jgi:3'-phosphoadenosine 5'-phosphosulfate (PAPS) 3'-phosphatase
VTIADFAVQALVVYYLNKAFPDDKFIAEENSELIREDKGVRDDILRALRAASDIDWTEELLFNTIDKGGFDGSADRVWVLDPVDGTKGFMRGEHYCIALALLIDGIPSLSVMGCPNLHLENVLEPKIGAKELNGLTGSKNKFSVSFVEESVTYPAIESKSGIVQDRKVFSPRGGSIFFAVTGQGAFARPLAMPLGGAYEVQVSDCKEASDSVLCESAEATHGYVEIYIYTYAYIYTYTCIYMTHGYVVCMMLKSV